jgi:hypothetical protein
MAMNRQTRRRAVGATGPCLWLVVLALGCGKGEAPRSSDARAFCDSYFGAIADHTVACQGGSRAAYTALLATADFCQFVGAEVSAGALTFDPAAAAACLGEIASLACWQQLPGLADCANVFVGRIPEGGDCYAATPPARDECVSGTRCVETLTCPGTCVRYAQLNEPCTNNNSDGPDYCAQGLTCDQTTLVCTAPASPRPAPTPGSPCSFETDCWSDGVQLTCLDQNGPVQSGGAGTCQPPSDTGACYYGGDCRSDICQGATPNTVAGSCVAPKIAGDPCTPGARECGPGTYCAATGTCTILPAVGQPCAGYMGEGQECVNGVCDPASITCIPFGKLGDACQPGFIFSSCNFYLACDATTLRCAPVCARGNLCGGRGQVCCAGRCNEGVSCVSGQCQ